MCGYNDRMHVTGAGDQIIGRSELRVVWRHDRAELTRSSGHDGTATAVEAGVSCARRRTIKP